MTFTEFESHIESHLARQGVFLGDDLHRVVRGALAREDCPQMRTDPAESVPAFAGRVSQYLISFALPHDDVLGL